MEHWIRADRWRAELFRAHDTVPTNDIIAFGVALLGELAKRGAPHGALCPEMISVRREGSALRVQIDPKSWPTDPTQEMTLAMGSKSMTARPGIHYRAPEQFTAHEYDQRADCFAVGVMLYELAAGRLPFGQDKTRPFDVFLALRRGGFPSLRQFRRDIPDALATAITSMLALRVEERTQDTTTIASALRAIARSPARAPTAVETKAEPTAPTRAAPAPSVALRPTGGQATASPLPERPAPDRAAVPLDPLRPIETGVLPVATQAAIAAFRAGQTQQPAPLTDERRTVSATARAPQLSASPPIPLGPPAQPAPVVTTITPATPTAPAPKEVPLPVRAIVEAVTRREPPVPAPPCQPDQPANAPIAVAPPAAPVTRQPIVMVPPRTAPPLKPVVVAPAPPAPRASVELVQERPPERTQVTGPPTQMERQLAPRPVEPLRVEPAPPPSPAPLPAAPRTLPPPAPPPRVERSVEPPAQPTVIAPPPPALIRATAPTIWPPPDVSLPALPVHLPKQIAPPPTAPIAAPAPPRPPEPLAKAGPPPVAPRPVNAPVPSTLTAVPAPRSEDTAQRSNGEVTPPRNSATKTRQFRGRDAIILSVVLLVLGISAGLLFQLPSRAAAPALAPRCEPGPGKACPPPPEPVAMPDPTPIVCDPQKPCEPPKPSPKLTCFYDNYSKGQRRYLRGDRRGALEAFHAAEVCMPRNPRLLQWLGRCYEELRERDEAHAYYERYLRRRPRADDADYYRQRLNSLEHPNGGTPHDGGTR